MSQMNLPFEQLTSYDKPQVLLTQLLDNELTARGALQTLVDADGLSPNERDMFTTRLKERVGRNPITDTAIDVLTNPFVLLMMVTTPAAGTALGRVGRSIFDVGERYSPYVREQGGLLASLGMLAPTQLFKGTGLTPAVQAFTKGVDQLEREMMKQVADPLRRVLEKHGLESLNPELVKDSAKRAVAQELNDALFASLAGFDRKTTQGRLKQNKKTKPYKYSVSIEETKPLVSANLDLVIDGLGLRELRDAYRGAMEWRRMRMFGDEAASLKAGTFVPDEQKLLRAWQGLGFGSKGAFKGASAEVAAMVVGPDFARMVDKGNVDPAELYGLMSKLIESQPSSYMPRNLIDLKGARSMREVLEQRRSNRIVATGSTLGRTSLAGTWDPEDLERMFSRFGSTVDGQKMLVKSRSKVQKILDRGETARTYRMNAQESLSRYFRDTGVTHSLYVQTEDQLPVLSQRLKDVRKLASKDKLAQLDDAFKEQGLLDGRKSLARVFQEEHFLLEDRFAKESLETILRGAMGMEKVEHMATHMALIRGKQGIRAMLDSGVGKALRDSGQWGSGVYRRLDEMADAELTFGEAKSMGGNLARYFYVTHLGLNLGSVTMNLMQPLLYASIYGGLDNVLKGYTQAFKELGGYMTERVGRHGFKALTDLEHQDLIGRHFKFANVDGENLVQIGRDTFSTLDSISYKSQALGGVNRKESYFFDYPMKLFEKAEWLNRNVAAHSVENAYAKAGVDARRGTPGYQRMLNDVYETVGATQFGGSTLNTPMAFQGVGPFGRIGNNPLFRQFLSFPLRSVTTLAYDSPRMADRGLLKGLGQDWLRGMGISAMFYEFGKNTFGFDLSPGLFGASLTQVVGGDRFFQDGNEYIPIPPVVDIPINLVRGALDPGQRELLQNNLPRLIPGGVAAARTMNLLPDLPNTALLGLPGSLQKTYIDPSRRTEDGAIPVYKADGSLIDYQTPGMIFAKALGVDMNQFKQTADFDGFLIKNRDQILQYRQRAIQALLGNDIPKMQSIKDEFKRRYKMDLTISKEQLDQAIKNRTVSRTERILDRMPPDQRPMFQQLAASRAQNLGIPADAIVGADTARQRMEARRIDPIPLTPEQQQIMAEEAARAKGGFPSFEQY
jgi:hypothetical protein